LTDDQLLDAMLKDPILINRPFVVTPLGTGLPSVRESSSRFCRKRTRCLHKEDGEQVLDSEGKRIV
jgi:arsenate reductase